MVRHSSVTDEAIEAILDNGQGIVNHVTCSSKEGEGVTDLYYAVIEAYLKNKQDPLPSSE